MTRDYSIWEDVAEWRGPGLQSLVTLVRFQPSSPVTVAQTDRAPGCGPGRCEFEPHRSPFETC